MTYYLIIFNPNNEIVSHYNEIVSQYNEIVSNYNDLQDFFPTAQTGFHIRAVL